MKDKQNVQINMQRIPVGSGLGAALLIVILLMGMFLELPRIRGNAVAGGGIGLVLAVALIWWRRRNAGHHPAETRLF
jgi:high-affinity Fe2+/Pb2+ permease